MCEPTLDMPAAVRCNNCAHRYSGRAESLMGMRITSHLDDFYLRGWLREPVTVASLDACREAAGIWEGIFFLEVASWRAVACPLLLWKTCVEQV